MTAGDMVPLLRGDYAHALLLRNPPRTRVGNRFRHTQHRKLQFEKPKVGYCIAGFGHETLALPLGCNPETSVFVVATHEPDTSDDPAGIGLQPQRPMPGVAALHGGQCNGAEERGGSVRRVWAREPGH